VSRAACTQSQAQVDVDASLPIVSCLKWVRSDKYWIGLSIEISFCATNLRVGSGTNGQLDFIEFFDK
jgi:hypothetical protein